MTVRDMHLLSRLVLSLSELWLQAALVRPHPLVDGHAKRGSLFLLSLQVRCCRKHSRKGASLEAAC